ncbi:MAG: histidine kinase [Aureispira sp.]
MPFSLNPHAFLFLQKKSAYLVVKTLFFLLLFPLVIWGQQPSYQVVGAGFLEGKDIYSLLEGENKELWIGTDEGLIRYDGKDFKEYSNPQLKNNSVFALCKNSQGEVFYANFSGQIMWVHHDSLELYYELPDSMMVKGIDIEIDNRDEVLVFCKNIIRIDKEKKRHDIYTTVGHPYAGKFAKCPDQSLGFNLGDHKIVAYWKDGILKQKAYKTFPALSARGTNQIRVDLYHNGQEEVLMSRDDTVFLLKKEDVFIKRTLPHSGSRVLHVDFTSNHTIWVSQFDKGLLRVNNRTAAVNPTLLFPDYYISYVLEDSEGNIWLGTFKKGLLRIPNLEVLDFRNHAFLKNNAIKHLTAGVGDTLYVISDKELVYQIDPNTQIKSLVSSPTKSSHFLQYIPQSKRLYFDNHHYQLTTKKLYPSGMVSFKDLQFLPPNNLLFSDFAGVTIYSTNDKKATLKAELDRYTYLKARKLEKQKYDGVSIDRISSLHYQTVQNRFWLGTNKNLVVLQNGDSLQIKYQGHPIVATHITSWNDTTYIATANEILKFTGTTCQGLFDSKNAPLLDRVYQMEQHQGCLYMAGVGGLQRINLTTGIAQTIDVADGLLSDKVLEFALLQSHMAILTSQGLQKIPYELLEEPLAVLKIGLEHIYMNGKEVNAAEDGQFDYNENELKVVLHLPYFRDRSVLSYRYRLLGLGKESWKELPSTQQTIVYNSLGKGAYTLEIEIKDHKRLEGEITRYSFQIAPPFWETWWFILWCILGVAGVVSLFFWVRIRIIQQQNTLLLEKKAIEKQLVESQQTALRSQMNPHFLFNALNSIQEMIIVNDKNTASTYLGKFADLMRLYLNQSREESITLSEELDALGLYLELEQVRFEENLDVALFLAPNINPDGVTLPPMLIQPYVENAFKHGLLHQSGHRTLYIEFSIDEEKEQFCCLVQDNGVGRVRSAEIRRAQHRQHTSFASSATQRRLELLNYNLQKPITAQIEDLKNEEGKATGTAVYLFIPLDWED